MTTLHERVSTLEAATFRIQRDEAATRAAAEQVAEQYDHLRDGIDTVSGDLRALTNEVHAEVVPRLDDIDARLSALEGGQRDILARLGGVENRIGGVEQGVSALLAHFNITSPEPS